jgi:hypothetical protein
MSPKQAAIDAQEEPIKRVKRGAENQSCWRLQTAGLYGAKPAIDALIRKSTHMVFSLQPGCEVTPAGELRIRSVFKVYVTFP